MKHLKPILALCALTLLITACGGGDQFKLAADIPAKGDLEIMAPQAVTLEASNEGKASLLIEVSANDSSTYQAALAVDSIEGSATNGDLVIPESDKVRGTTAYQSAFNANLDVQLVPGQYYLTINGERAPVDITVVKHGSKPPTSVAG